MRADLKDHFVNNFSFILSAWKNARHVLPALLTASFIINLLSLAFPIAILQIYDRIIPNSSFNTLLLLVSGVILALLLEALLRIIRSYVSAWADARYEHIEGTKLFQHLISSRLSDIENIGSGAHIKRLNALHSLRDFYSGQAIVSAADVPFIIILLSLIYYVSNALVLVPLFMIGIYVISTWWQSRNIRENLSHREGKDNLRFNFIIETLSNIHTVKALTLEAQMMRRYERLQKSSYKGKIDMGIQSADSIVVGMTLSQITLVLVVAIGSISVIHGSLTVGGLAAVTLLSGRVLQPLTAMVKVIMRFKSIEVARKNIDDVYAMQLEGKSTRKEAIKIEGKLELRNVGFRYNANTSAIFEHLNLTIEKNEAIGLSGEGQCGKSTLLRMILGILEPTAGQVLFDDQDLNQLKILDVRDAIGYMPQKCMLFNGTILENLTMFQIDKFDDRVHEICSGIGLEEVINNLPRGYDTVIGHQTAESLSRGISQRIAIARALIRDPRIIIFDEANSAIDMQGDALIRQMLLNEIGKRTMIIVSHRPSILNITNRQFVIRDRQLKEKQ